MKFFIFLLFYGINDLEPQLYIYELFFGTSPLDSYEWCFVHFVENRIDY